MRAFSVDSTAWPVIRVKGSGGAGMEGAMLGLCEQGAGGPGRAACRRVSREGLLRRRQQPLQVGSAGGRLAGGGGLCQGSTWVRAWLGQQGEEPPWRWAPASQQSVGRCVCELACL